MSGSGFGKTCCSGPVTVKGGLSKPSGLATSHEGEDLSIHRQGFHKQAITMPFIGKNLMRIIGQHSDFKVRPILGIQE
jgi:hypothetical protein